MSTELLTLLGGLITFLLSVNAWFFKDVTKTLSEIKLELMKIGTEHEASRILLNKHDDEIDRVRERLHALEGWVPGIKQALEELKEN